MCIGGKNSQNFHFRNYLFKKNTILGRNLKKFEILSNFVTLKADIYETMHFQKIFHQDKSSQNGLISLSCMFLQKNRLCSKPAAVIIATTT